MEKNYASKSGPVAIDLFNNKRPFEVLCILKRDLIVEQRCQLEPPNHVKQKPASLFSSGPNPEYARFILKVGVKYHFNSSVLSKYMWGL